MSRRGAFGATGIVWFAALRNHPFLYKITRESASCTTLLALC